jgi:Helitron helicase-like domain at N-terminus
MGYESPQPKAGSILIFFSICVHALKVSRFARHRTFLYLMYDVIRLRKSSLGHRLLVKRRDGNATVAEIESLTVKQLRDAPSALTSGQIIHDPAITKLLRKLNSIGNPVPQSISQKLKLRSMIKELLARWDMPAFWLTINPSDLRDPIVLILGGIRYSSESFPAATVGIRRTCAVSNPAAVAQFFYLIYTAIFEDLLRSHSDKMGALGQVSNHGRD